MNELEARQRTERTERLADRERLYPPRHIQTTRAVRPGGGGSPRLWAKVVRGLLKADPLREPEAGPTAGYGEYVMRLLTDGTAEWSSLTTYSSGDAAIGSDDRKYTSKANDNLNHDPVSDVEETWWAISGEISPRHINRRSTVDLRPFVPWLEPGEIVELVFIIDTYYIAETLTYIGVSTSSIIWVPGDGTPGRMAAVFA